MLISAKYCDQSVCMYVCLSLSVCVCFYVCLSARVSKNAYKINSTKLYVHVTCVSFLI